jgi:hypothetical protein
MSGGLDTRKNVQIIPNTTVALATTGHSILSNEGNELFSVMEYGLGWARTAYRGHEVSISALLASQTEVTDTLRSSSSGTTVVARAYRHFALCSRKTVSLSSF